MMIRRLVSAGEEAEYVNLDLVGLDEGDTWDASSDLETAAVVLAGQVDVCSDGGDFGRAGGRSDVFEGPGHTVYIPPDSGVRLTAVGEADLALASVPPGPASAGPARVIGPEDQRIGLVGEGNWSRLVRTILGPEHAASRLLLGETVNPPGHWSSYPPHKHDVQSPPDEVRLEEVYLFRVDPSDGFGVQVRYDDQGHDEATVVRGNDFCVISSGYHPVVAAPGYYLYYLWVMAGQGREMVPHFDVRHAWVQQGELGAPVRRPPK